MFFFFKQKTAYEMRISDWSSDGALPISGLDERLQVDIESGRATNQRADAFVEQHHQRPLAAAGRRMHEQIGRASCRERVCQYVSISVVAVSFNKKNNRDKSQTTTYITYMNCTTTLSIKKEHNINK